MRALRFLLLCGLIPLAQAQAANNTQKISWTPPTQYSDGSAVPSTVVLTYNLYAKLGTAAEVKLGSGLSTSVFTTAAMPVGQRNCYTITVLADGIESPRSAEACGVIAGLATKPVTVVVVQ